MGKTGFVQHPLYLEHIIDEYHPESPQRLYAIYEMVKRDFAGKLTAVEPREATHEELAWVHDKNYIEHVASTEGRFVRLDPDTGTCPKTYRAALLSTGGILAAVDALYDKTVDNVFTATRPPGHHAESNRSAGFCLFNNVAVAAEYARRKHGAERVLIYDWDLHHGNGTQHSFEDTDRVLYMSSHQFPYYPGTGNFTEIGHGAGKHYTINMPLSSGFGDGDFMMLVDRIVAPVARAYEPDLVIISAGYDTYEHDPLGAMNVTPHGYGAMTHRLIEVANQCCDGRLMVVLEGGYHTGGLSEGVKCTLQTMLDGHAPEAWMNAEPLREEATAKIIERVEEIHSSHWPQIRTV